MKGHCSTPSMTRETSALTLPVGDSVPGNWYLAFEITTYFQRYNLSFSSQPVGKVFFRLPSWSQVFPSTQLVSHPSVRRSLWDSWSFVSFPWLGCPSPGPLGGIYEASDFHRPQTHMHMQTHTHKHMYSHTYTYYTHAHIPIHIYTTLTCLHAHTNTHMYIQHTNSNTCTQYTSHTRTHINTHKHTHTKTHIHARMHACTHIHTPQTRTYTNTHMHIYTYKHTYIHKVKKSFELT